MNILEGLDISHFKDDISIRILKVQIAKIVRYLKILKPHCMDSNNLLTYQKTVKATHKIENDKIQHFNSYAFF